MRRNSSGCTRTVLPAAGKNSACPNSACPIMLAVPWRRKTEKDSLSGDMSTQAQTSEYTKATQIQPNIVLVNRWRVTSTKLPSLSCATQIHADKYKAAMVTDVTQFPLRLVQVSVHTMA